MKYAQRNKKIYAICIALLFIISSSAALIPNLEVRASETINIKNTPFYDLIPTGDQLFDLQYYDIDNTDLDDEIKYGCNDSIIPAEGRAYYNSLSPFIEFLNDKDNNNTQFNGGDPFNDINIVTNDSGLIDYLNNPNNYYSLVTITMNSTTFTLSVFYSDINFLDNVYCTNGGGATFSYNGTIKRFEIGFLMSNDSSHTAISPNVFTQSNSSGIPYMSSGYYLCYCTCPLYFVYVTNQYGDTYSNLNSSSNIRTFLANGESSPFLIDRREYFTNYTGGNLTVDTDPVSLDSMGAWDIDIVPVNDLIDGKIMVNYLPSKKLSDDYSNFKVNYWFALTAATSKISTNSISQRPSIYTMLHTYYPSLTDQAWLDMNNFTLDNYYTVTCPRLPATVSNEYEEYNTSTVLSLMKPYVGKLDFPVADIDVSAYDALHMYDILGWYSQNIGASGGISGNLGSYGSVSVGITSSGQNITALKLTVYAQAFDGNKQVSNVATATYNYLDGSITKTGTTSSNNDTPIDENTGLPEGMTQKEMDEIDKNINNINSSGGTSITTGDTNSNSNSNANGGTATATADNNIEVQSNWKYFIDSTEENEENANGLSAIQQGYEEIINFDYENDSFLQFLFTSGIWSIHPFDYILAFLGTMVTIGIFTGILKLFRG